MRIKKCDICKKTINNNIATLTLWKDYGVQDFEFCHKCAKPLTKFLEDNKLFNRESGKSKKDNK